MEPITRTAKDEGVIVTLTFIPGEKEDGTADPSKIVQLLALNISLQTPERAKQFKDLLVRALNTADPDVSPDWAMTLLDYLTGVPQPAVRPTPKPAEDFPLGQACNINDPDCEACQ